MDALIVAAFARHDMESLAEGTTRRADRLRPPQRGFAGLSAHPQLRRAAVATPAGTVEIVAPPARHGDDDARPLRPVPALGAQSEAIRGEFAVEGAGIPTQST